MRFYCTSTGPIGGLNCEVLLYIFVHMYIGTYIHMFACTYVRIIHVCEIYIFGLDYV